MAEDNGGESPHIHELGDAPDITRMMAGQATANKTIVASWSSLEVFASQFKGDNGSTWWARNNVRNHWSENFNGTNSFDEALDLAIHGWEEGGALIEKTRGYIQALNPLSPKLIKYGIAGTTPNVPRAIAGNLLNMRQPAASKSQKKKTITIVYNMCENGGCNKDAITNKAAVTAALIDEIEAKGFACEVIAAVVTNGGMNYAPEGWVYGIKAYEYVRVKESHQPVDINRLAFGLGHAAMFRGLFFADMQRHRIFSEIGESLGSATTTLPTKELCEEQIYTIVASAGGIKMNSFKDIETSATTGLNSIVRALREQGCPAFPALKDHEDGLEEPAEAEEDTEPYYS